MGEGDGDRDEPPGAGAGPWRKDEDQPSQFEHLTDDDIEKAFSAELLNLQFDYAAKVLTCKRGTPRAQWSAAVKAIRREQAAAKRALLHRQRLQRKARRAAAPRSRGASSDDRALG